MFASVDDASLAERIDRAKARVVYVAPGVGKRTADALIRANQRDSVSVTIILDADEEACRVGYADADALGALHEAMKQQVFPLRRHPGIRIGLVIADDELVIWSPTARSVEAERDEGQPNAIVLSAAEVPRIEAAVGAEGSPVLPGDAEVGRVALRPEETARTIKALEDNPPEPFDLARKTRVFSTRFQFVEFEVQGAEWTERRIKLSSFLLNADLPDELSDIMDTWIRPFQSAADHAFPVPLVVNGRPAYERNGDRMLVESTQAEILETWHDIRNRYLRPLKGFGWLIARDKLQLFRQEVASFEEVLSAWVKAFRNHVVQDEVQLINSIAASLRARIQRATRRERYEEVDLEGEIKRGLQRLRVIEPRVRIVLKNVSWESSRDREFLSVLRTAFTEQELAGWFEEFTAARERPAPAQR